MASPDRVNISAIERYFPRIPSSLKIGKEISRGSYGTVHEGQVNDRPVAVKRIHRIHLEPPCNERTSILLDKFQQECSLLEEADNVHVVQLYGTYYDEESQELILVMEKLQQTLIEYLSANRGNLSLQRQAEICLEIVNGVHFLHSLVPPVIHLDLNDKNVMLTEEGLVKVGDLGQSCLKEGNIDYFTTAQPGAIQFMPPEALQEAAHYDEKIDTFSIGVLMLEIATQQSPQVRLLGIGVVPEVKRRAKDFSKLGENHPLKPIIINCLRIDPTQRPNTGALQRKLQTLIEKLQTGSEAIVPQEVTPSPANEEQLLETQDSWEPGTIVVAKHKFAAPVPTELPFEKGDRLTILSVSRDPNWYKARAEDGAEGMIPANYVAKPQPPPLPIRMRPHRQVTLPVPPPRVIGMSKRSTVNREASFRRICSSSDAAQLRKMSWFHGKISRSEVEAKMNPKRDGLFLIRECQTYPGDYALSLW
jgi:serine/threonine protein kinase